MQTSLDLTSGLIRMDPDLYPSQDRIGPMLKYIKWHTHVYAKTKTGLVLFIASICFGKPGNPKLATNRGLDPDLLRP